MTTTRDYDAARAALYALVPRGIVLGLAPVREALAALGDPQRRIPAVHVAGTNGKGSAAAMVDAALRSAGRRVGLYTSPHLHEFRERVRVDGEPASRDEIARAAWEVLDGVSDGRLPALTFFEATTVLAWRVFEQAKVDTVVLEVGLGGRLDATSVCQPVVTAITRIARDHEALLGDTLSAIAREKAGILKPGVPCVLGPDLRDGEARAAIEETAHAVGAPLFDAPRVRRLTLGDDLRARLEVDAASGTLPLDLALSGAHQAGNAAVAVGVLEHMGVARDAIREGLATVRWPARLERTHGTLFDAAHNPDGVAALVAALDRLPNGPRAMVFGASSDKDWRQMLTALGAHFDPAHRFYCAASLKRAEDPATLDRFARGSVCASVDEALSAARQCVGAGGLVVVCGSIFVVAEARAHVLGVPHEPPVAL